MAFRRVVFRSFDFDVREDVLYCDRPDSLQRRACRSVLDHLFSCLTAWLAPILCFTAAEAWWARGSGQEASVHLRTFPAVPARWLDRALAATWRTEGGRVGKGGGRPFRVRGVAYTSK